MAGEDDRPVDLAGAKQLPKPHLDSNSDSVARNERAFFDHEENMQSGHIGWIGKVWGGKYEKPGNISVVVILFLVSYIGLMIFAFPTNPHFKDVFMGLTSIITLILGYLFGSSDRK